MKPKNKLLTLLGPVFFFAGALIGIIFIAALLWPSIEASFYFGYNGGADTKLRLSCPHIMTPADTAAVTAFVTNKVEKPISPIFEAQLSGPILQTIRTNPSIEPGQTAALKWDITADNIDFGHLILAQVYQFSSYKTSTAMANCGTLYLFIPGITGNEIYVLSFVVSMVLIITGIGLSRIGGESLANLGQGRLSGMIFLGGIVLVGILLGTLGQWLLGTLTLVLAILMLAIQIGRQLSPS